MQAICLLGDGIVNGQSELFSYRGPRSIKTAFQNIHFLQSLEENIETLGLTVNPEGSA